VHLSSTNNISSGEIENIPNAEEENNQPQEINEDRENLVDEKDSQETTELSD
jgi:hypothetical protein